VSLFAQNQFSNFFGFGQFPQPDQFVDYFNVGGSAPEAQRLRPPFTLTRAQLAGVRAAAISSNGVTWQEYAADLARFNGAAQGLLIEGQRTTLLTTARAPATETVTVTAAAHVLSFVGTGTVTLSGAATGTLTGTGANDRVTLPFTPSAGSLTLTVSGAVSLWQLELGAFATTPVLHPIGTPGAATRGQDFVTAPLSALDIPASGACTVLMRAVFNNSVGAGQANQSLLTLDDGTSANGFRLRAGVVSDVIVATRALAGAGNNSASSGAYTPGAVFRTGATIDGTGAMRVFTAGGSVQGVTGGPTSGLTTMRLGINGVGGGAMNGEILTMRLLPQPLSDTDLQAAVNAL
jgi:hypothetical protein